MNASVFPEGATADAAGPDGPRDAAEGWLARSGLVVALAVLLTARALGLHEGQVLLPGMPWPLPVICTLRRMTGWACPGCGLTRSLIALAHGDARAAWRFNPAGYLLFALLLVQIPLGLLQEARRWAGRPLLRLLPLYRGAVAVLLSSLVGQWLVRLVAGGL
jgi:hypothetical protein